MTVELNKFNNNYGLYNLTIANKLAQENAKKAEQTDEKAVVNNEFVGLKNETDLLTKNAQNLYRTEIKAQTAEDRRIADTTNEILASLGYTKYKVTSAQVASVAANMQNNILPGIEEVEASAVEARISDINGPFAELFA